VDLHKEWVVRDEDMHSKCGWTPYHGLKLKGKAVKTVVKGKLAFEG